MATPPARPPSTVVLDLGGVVLRVDWRPVIALLREDTPEVPEDLEQQVGAWAAYHRYERGESSSAEFFAALRQHFHLPTPQERVLQAWNVAVAELLPGAMSVLRRCGARVPLFAFTNTNAAHYAYISATLPLFSAFQTVFASHELGQRKPEPRAYDLVSARLPCEPGAVLYIDDKLENVAAARTAGWQAEQCVNDTERLAGILSHYNVL